MSEASDDRRVIDPTLGSSASSLRDEHHHHHHHEEYPIVRLALLGFGFVSPLDLYGLILMALVVC
jgi:hypothetical protein